MCVKRTKHVGETVNRIAQQLCLSLVATVLVIGQAHAEANQVRIASPLGLAQLPGRIAYEMKFIEARAKERGLDVSVTYQNVASGSIVSELVLSGNADIGVGGNVSLFNLWDKTSGAQKVRGVMAFSQANMFLITVDPHINSIRDFGEKDRIAMTDVKGTTYSMLLQMFAAKEFGWDQRTKLDNLAVGMSNNDAMISLIKGATEVKSHMTVLPNSSMELASGKARIILSSKDLLGTPYTATAAFATEKFRNDNPKLYDAIVAGLLDAIKYINDNPEAAAAIYMKTEPFIGTPEDLVKMVKGQTADELSFTPVPRLTKVFMDFMFKSGTLRKTPDDWKDVWFDNVWGLPGG
jgi:NitT/TauT family transport system substrate-binding protein